MSRGIYTATSGLLTIIRDINVRSNNMANVATAGFKEDRLVTTTFAEAIAQRQDIRTIGAKIEIGTSVRGKKALEIQTNFMQGGLEFTSRTLDFAIAGEGFFTIGYMESEDADDYTVYYTRNGQFQISPYDETTDEGGYLVFGDAGHYVLDEDGERIQIINSNLAINERSAFTINEFGTLIAADETDIATLGIFVPQDPDLLIKKDDESFSAPWDLANNEPYELETLEFTGIIWQGYTERSNVDMAAQMAALIANSRSYQSMTQIIKTIDAVKNKSANELGKV